MCAVLGQKKGLPKPSSGQDPNRNKNTYEPRSSTYLYLQQHTWLSRKVDQQQRNDSSLGLYYYTL